MQVIKTLWWYRSIIPTLILFSACSTEERSDYFETAKGSTEAVSEADLHEERTKSLTEFLSLRSMPHPAVGLAQFNTSTMPVVFVPDLNNKFILFQVARCQSLWLESDLTYTWSDVKTHCELLTDKHPQAPFFDLTASTGSWKWVVRACLPQDHQKSFVCHEKLMTTKNGIMFTNQNSIQISDLSRSIQQKKIKIAELTYVIQSSALELASAYERCDLKTWKKAENLIKRSIIANVVGYGAALILKIYSKQILDPKNSTLTWRSRFDSMWTQDSNDQKAIVRTLLWLFTSEDDFFETCADVQNIKHQSALNLLKVKEYQLLLAEELDALNQFGVDISGAILQ